MTGIPWRICSFFSRREHRWLKGRDIRKAAGGVTAEFRGSRDRTQGGLPDCPAAGKVTGIPRRKPGALGARARPQGVARGYIWIRSIAVARAAMADAGERGPPSGFGPTLDWISRRSPAAAGPPCAIAEAARAGKRTQIVLLDRRAARCRAQRRKGRGIGKRLDDPPCDLLGHAKRFLGRFDGIPNNAKRMVLKCFPSAACREPSRKFVSLPSAMERIFDIAHRVRSAPPRIA